ncbi:MAG TPA: DmsE family decaheme c-type cytochrome [Candidatus Acidoferrum sp.]|nr:DmsE family decaheme c-type cytochrome [Candidatus Acidoferrum sp.]
MLPQRLCSGLFFGAGDQWRRCGMCVAAAALIFIPAVIFLIPAANAEGDPQTSAVSALRDFVQQIDHQPNNFARDDSANAAIAALASFSEGVGAAQQSSTADLPKLADADSLLDFLRQGGFSAKPAKPSAAPSNGPIAGGTQPSAPVDATYVGAKVCTTCHAAQAEQFSHTLMGRIGKTQKGKFDCENCHGPGSAHVKAGGGRGVGGIISFRPEDRSRTAEENNAICLNCHQRGDRTNWPGSTHEVRGLMCTNCHTVMKQVSRKFQLKTAFEPDTCFQCHKDRRAQMFRSSHMPMREGKIVCSDCHNPHGSFTEALLKKDSINDTCYTCHAEKRGPFLFEHLPVRENCDNCHDPHGSVNEFSLKMSRPRLCFECHQAGHGSTSGVNAGTTMGRACQNCHTNVHGSNSPAGGALQR